MSSLQQGYIAGLLSGLSSLRQMIVAGLVQLSLSQSSRLMKREEQESVWQAVLSDIPPGGYLAVDYVKVKHEGVCIQGVDQEQSPQGLIWGHRFLTSSIVFTDRAEVYPLRADASLSKRMATEAYPYLSPSEAMLNVVGDVLVSDYDLRGAVVDSEFTSKLVLRSLPYFPVGIVGRFRSNTNVTYDGQTLAARDLAEQFPPGKARFYRSLDLYAKRLTVDLPDVGQLDLIFIWLPDGISWKLCILVSTIQAGVQELIKAYKARWGLEVIHRALKQNLALLKCQCLTFAAQLRHINWAMAALRQIYQQKRLYPHLNLRQAQSIAAQIAKDALLTP